MDNHRSGPVCNHAAFARGVLTVAPKIPSAKFVPVREPGRNGPAVTRFPRVGRGGSNRFLHCGIVKPIFSFGLAGSLGTKP